MGYHSIMNQTALINATRILFLSLFVYYGINCCWQSFAASLCFLSSMVILKPTPQTTQPISPRHHSHSDNPLKGKPKLSERDLTEEQLYPVHQKISQLATYDAESVDSLQNFSVVKQNTQCVFARNSRIWGSPDWKAELALEENVQRSLCTFYKFSMLCQTLGLDGFLYELPGKEFGSNVKTLSDGVRRLLKVLSDNDPADIHCMNKSYISKKGWVFEFNRITFFVTTFAPFYPETHSRFTFGAPNSYIMFQPEISFAQHDLPTDTAETDWEEPKTIRDQIRAGFRNAGRGYLIRDTIYFPMAHDVVKPVVDDGSEVVEWWVPQEA